ncbi:hypothetical protein [Pleionea sp. CnH1-48]|uniref:hypothetical protein n=1 Tax=Pleionea sp. CnH1-48 TaxID=2954494 RepID=UPI00209709A0|nr:hypothetical protein [Pleionea sp. CnH1-48]MCO7223930.1 hypothetical protein [Pleionea sp. CnH1-48]
MTDEYPEQNLKRDHSSSSKTQSLIATVSLAGLAFIVLLVLFYKQSWSNAQLQSKIVELEKEKRIANQELDILRTLSPYPIDTNQSVAESLKDMTLAPGWVARVYPVPNHLDELNNKLDMGSFVLDERQFTLTSHKQYGVKHLGSALYRLNALFPTLSRGRHQIGVQIGLSEAFLNNYSSSLLDVTCYIKVSIDQNQLIDKRIKLANEKEVILTGELHLEPGTHPISSIFYCDKHSDANGEDIIISLSFRNPGEHSLSNHRNSVYHIYKNQFSINGIQHQR